MKVLTVDNQIATDLGIGSYVNLFPAANSKVPWSIDIDEYPIINEYITKFSDETVKYLKEINFLNYDSSLDSYMKLVRPPVAQLLYYLLYRLIRIIRFTNNINEKVLLLNTREFSAPVSLNHIYNLARDSWEFNQYVVNTILSGYEKFDHEEKDILYPENYWDLAGWSNYTGFGTKVQRSSKIKRLLKKPSMVVQEKIKRHLYSLSSSGRDIPVYLLGYNGDYFLKNGLFWPLGRLSRLPQQLPVSSTSGSLDRFGRNNFANQANDHFVQGITGLLKVLNIDQYNKAILNGISTLVFQLYPINLFEGAKTFCDWSVHQLSKYKVKHYFTYDTAASDIAIFYNYAATKLGFKVWSQQHSAWGGYLANVPNIAEISIAGSDYYMTSGWKHKEISLPTWKIDAVPLSSPQYSEIQRARIKPANNRSILLLTGEIYQYPTLPAGSHYIDGLMFWAEKIRDIISELVEKDIKVLLKNYAPRVETILENNGILKEWTEVGGSGLEIIRNIEKGSARKYFSQVSATIWDMPAGGFIESVLSGVPAFSFWHDQHIQHQPNAEKAINSLISAGIFNGSGVEMAMNVEKCINNDKWYNDSLRLEAVNTFLNQYIKINNNWKNEWQSILNRL